MTELLLVRHGQANSDAQDEESYDVLSDLGRRQAGWLGEYLRATNPHFDQVITGTLNRQADTARAMGFDISRQDERLNEMRYFAIAHAIESALGLPSPQSATDYVAHLPVLLRHWAEGEVPDMPDRFEDFSHRTYQTISELSQNRGRILVVTSGGVIGMIVGRILGLDTKGLAHVMLQISNSSMTRLQFVHDQLMVNALNAAPHLDPPDRAHARTYI